MSAEQKQMEANFKAYLVTWRNTARERMTVFAERGESARKHGHPVAPPLEIVEYPDLLERAWGWDRILPYDPFDYWPRYEKYLRDYYSHNKSLYGDDGTDLTALAESCIKMEGSLKALLDCCPQAFHEDEIIRSEKVITCVGQMINIKCCEFPAAAIALKCIAKETDLTCELVRNGIISPYYTNVNSDIRQCALSFMTYKGDEYIAAAATMMGAIREAEVMCKVLRKELDDKKGAFSMSHYVRGRTLGAMIKMYYEFPVTEDCTRGSAAGKLDHGESADKSTLETISVKEGSPRERNDTKGKNKEEPIDGDYQLKETNKSQRTKEADIKVVDLNECKNQKAEVEVLKQDILAGKRHMRHGSKLAELLKISSDEESEDTELLNPSEQKKPNRKLFQRVSKSAAEGKKLWSLNAGCFSWAKS